MHHLWGQLACFGGGSLLGWHKVVVIIQVAAAASTSLIPINGQPLMTIQFSSWGLPESARTFNSRIVIKLLKLGGKSIHL